MTTPNPALKQLKDIHLPQAVHMWPIAPGWIMLYIIGVMLIAFTIHKWLQRKKRLQALRYAKQQLLKLRELCAHNPDNINIAAELSTLIRRTALYYYPRETIAGLSGNEWLQFLNNSGNTTQFTDKTGQLLIDAPYRKQGSADLNPLFALTEQWLNQIGRHHQKETQ